MARAKQLTVTWPEGTPSRFCGGRSMGSLCVCSNESNDGLGTTGARTTVLGARRARASMPSIEPSASKTNAPGMSGVQKSSASQPRSAATSVRRITGPDSTPRTPTHANRVGTGAFVDAKLDSHKGGGGRYFIRVRTRYAFPPTTEVKGLMMRNSSPETPFRGHARGSIWTLVALTSARRDPNLGALDGQRGRLAKRTCGTRPPGEGTAAARRAGDILGGERHRPPLRRLWPTHHTWRGSGRDRRGPDVSVPRRRLFEGLAGVPVGSSVTPPAVRQRATAPSN